MHAQCSNRLINILRLTETHMPYIQLYPSSVNTGAKFSIMFESRIHVDHSDTPAVTPPSCRLYYCGGIVGSAFL
jgi:hypothetical protein